MNVSAWAIRNPLAPTLLFAVLVMLGLWGFMRLPVTNYPRLDIPKVSVSVVLDHASPDQIETEVAAVVEDAVSSLAGLESISTTIDEGRAVVLLEFATSVPVDRAVAETRDAVSSIVPDLPPASEAPVIQREEQEEAPILTYSVELPGMSLVDLTWYVDDTVIRSLQNLPQIKRVERLGGANREIEIALDTLRMEALGLTVAGIAADLAREQIDTAAGISQAGGQDRALRIAGSASSVAELADLPLSHPAGASVRLADVATIRDGTEDARGFALFNGRQAVGISIIPAKSSSDLDAAEAVRVRIAQLAADSGAEFSLASEIVAFTHGNYEAAMVTLAEGAFLAVVVVFLFLRDWRATVVVALALPLSAIPTFFVIQQLGFSLNILSTLAITLVTGILVDDAIVEIENIARHQHQGKSAWRASLDASDEIGLAVIAISATIIAVFLPVGLMEGIIGQYFRQFGLTVAIAVFFSLVVARLFTPILAAYFMKNAPPEEGAEGPVLRLFRRAVMLAVRWRWVTVGLALASFTGGAMMLMSAPATFLPEMDAGSAVISMELPPGSTLEDTARTAQAATVALKGLPEVVSVLITGGKSPAGLTVARHRS
ncbi:efflux RND transporter permease subunit [Frigidibacter mobilis]|uniref:Acriflavin resistance protein n=1 Tax=Frigidibacter mobilis TaxID=1335048 RepID=A0A159Z3W8_9RHOB|nr:efflux RND transporter permease subunit [Frigidibacter mobilis]AMY68904.1 acriflavin resistance protein [Frigidibacter mobilis]